MIAVVMAGGMGTRLWPASRAKCPKQFLPLLGGHSPLEETLRRLGEILPPERIIIAVGAAHRRHAERCLAPGMRVICEPLGRGTAPCLGLIAAHLAGESPEEVLVALPADNWIAPGPEFAEALEAAADLAAAGGLVAVGTVPAHPAVGFGYIQPGVAVRSGRESTPAFILRGFVEKPDRRRAESFCAEGWFWHAGILAFRPAELRAEIRRLQPGLDMALTRIEGAIGGPDYESVLDETWRTLPMLSVEEGLLARGPARAFVVRGGFAWSDLGTWDAVREAALAAGVENAVSGEPLLLMSRDCLVRADGGRLVAVVGAEGLTIVDTSDALLILGPGHGQEVRRITRFLADEGRGELL